MNLNPKYFIKVGGLRGPRGFSITEVVDNEDGTFTIHINNGTSFTIRIYEHIEETTTGEIEETTASEIEQTGTSEIEQATAGEIEQTTTGEIEQTGTGEIEETTTSEIEQTGTSEIEQTGTGEIEETTTNEIEQTGTGEIEETTASEIEQTGTSEIEETTAGEIEETTTNEIEQTGTGEIEQVESSDTIEEELYPDNSTQGHLMRNAGDSTENSQITDDGTNPPRAPSFKIGDVAGGNYTEIEADGTIRFHGNATVFRDEERSLLTQQRLNPSDRLALNLEEGSVTYKNTATVTDFTITNIQLNHDRKHGANVFPHIHWWQTSANMPNWLLQYRWQVNGSAKETDWNYLPWNDNAFDYVSGELNQITRFGTITPPTGDGISDLLQIRLIRDVANASEEFTDPETSPINQDAVSLDAHIEIDTLGSRQEYTK